MTSLQSPAPQPTQQPAPTPVPTPSTGSGGPVVPAPWAKRHLRAILITTGVVLLAGGAGAAWAFLRPQTSEPRTTSSQTPAPATPAPTPVTKLSPLTGLPVSPQEADRPITAVVIENHTDARPQSGLADAGVVYEANAEGGITRFLAIFLDKRPTSIGPVRSLRTYAIDWALEFNAPVSHAGGSAEALSLVGPLKMKDINALSFGSSAFFRTSDRSAPHNLYTNADKLDALMTRLGFGVPSNFTPSPRKADAKPATAPHPNIHIEYSYNGYQVDYKYDPSTNDYARSLGGKPHIDRVSGQQIHVKNVVVQMMPTTFGTLAGKPTVSMQTVGTGKCWVMRDGDAIPCTWSKSSHTSRTKLLDATGADIPLNAGNTWYAIVPIGKTVTF